MSSLYRLIELAKRTGDRLIVHDPVNGQDTVIMSVDQYEDLLEGEQPIRPVEPDHGPEGMQAMGEMLQDRYADAASYFSYGDEISGYPVPVEENFHIPADHIEDYEQIMSDQISERDFAPVEEEIEAETEEEPIVEDIRSTIPKIEGAGGAQWEEESLDNDEPVFYEEPV